jgi:mRNA-degrading endonuclease RelE of RelBE toxin-antitoxin system
MTRRAVFFTDEFQKQIKQLGKRFRSIKDDVEPTITQLTAGETPGDRLERIKEPVFKVRLPNRDARRGKSGGYRLLYYLSTPERVVLLTIYSKTDISDVAISEILKYLMTWEQENTGVG